MRSFLMPYGTVGRIKRSGNHCETWAVRPDVPRNSRHPPVDIPGGADLKRLVFRLIGFNSISPRSGDLKLEDNRQTDVSAVPKWTSKLVGGGGRRSKGAENAQWKAGQSSKAYGKFAVSVATGNPPKRGFLNGRQFWSGFVTPIRSISCIPF